MSYDILMNNKSSLKLLDISVFLLLSDNKKLINSFSKLKHSTYSEDIVDYINFTPCVQAVLREDWKHLEELNTYTRINIEKKRGWKKHQVGLMFFESFLKKDSKKLCKNTKIHIKMDFFVEKSINWNVTLKKY